MDFQLVCLQIHLRVEHNKLLFHTFPVRAQEVILSKMNLERIVIDIVLLLSASITTIADVTTFVFVPTMRV